MAFELNVIADLLLGSIAEIKAFAKAHPAEFAEFAANHQKGTISNSNVEKMTAANTAQKKKGKNHERKN